MQGTRVLCVEDEDGVRRLVLRLLRSWGYDPVAAETGAEMRERLGDAGLALVLCDVNLPDASGIELLELLAHERPDVATVMVTGVDDPQFAECALELGAYGYVIKPFEPNELRISVSNALRRRALEQEHREAQRLLESAVEQRTVELRASVGALEQAERELRLTSEEMIFRLSLALESRDRMTGAHTDRVSHFAAGIALELGLAAHECEMIRIASPLHDVGKIAVPDAILLKRGPLSQPERAIIEAHAEAGYRILSGSGSELLDLAADIALTHHERVNGSGYPYGLHGDDIPLSGRIVAVADVYDALTSDRPYRPSLSRAEALEVLQGASGTKFDHRVVEAFMRSPVRERQIAGVHVG
ncbi:MAG TPA: HD domain-containing phosphohydrolase [Solirubrobacteraceae bacterium]|nr:HD domain-containing phosphohydrolase [Solirubrobacteraceae bacterium]